MRACPYHERLKNTVIAMENLRAEQGLPALDEMPDTRMLLPRKPQNNSIL